MALAHKEIVVAAEVRAPAIVRKRGALIRERRVGAGTKIARPDPS
jgi:hypothetical protein